MDVKSKFFLALICLLSAYAFGRFSAPERVKIETRIVEIEKKTDDKETNASRDKHKTTTTTETTRPDGTKETTTVVTEDSQTNKASAEHSVEEREKESTSLKEVTRSSSKVTIAAMYGIPITGGLPAYGGMISRPLLGPITGGLFYLTPNVIGGIVGLTF